MHEQNALGGRAGRTLRGRAAQAWACRRITGDCCGATWRIRSPALFSNNWCVCVCGLPTPPRVVDLRPRGWTRGKWPAWRCLACEWLGGTSGRVVAAGALWGGMPGTVGCARAQSLASLSRGQGFRVLDALHTGGRPTSSPAAAPAPLTQHPPAIISSLAHSLSQPGGWSWVRCPPPAWLNRPPRGKGQLKDHAHGCD